MGKTLESPLDCKEIQPVHSKGERNSRVVTPLPESHRCLSPFQGNVFSLHCLDFQAEHRCNCGDILRYRDFSLPLDMLVYIPGDSVVKYLPTNVGDTRDASLIPGSGSSPGVGNSNPLKYSCLENPMDRGACWVTVHGVAKNQTRLSK